MGEIPFAILKQVKSYTDLKAAVKYQNNMKDLTKQEKIVIALMRGHHLNKQELEIAKQQVHILKLHIKNRVL